MQLTLLQIKRDRPVAVFMIDLDGFKEINDRFGHALGDKVLRVFAETVRTKPFFRDAFKNGRCLMPVSGYYEWHWNNLDDKKEKPQPWYFIRKDGQVMTVAALCETWNDRAENQTIRSCAMVITEPNKFVAEVHDRMPVVLDESQFDQWMNGTPDEAAELMKPAPEDVLRKWPVSKRINSSRTPKDDPTLIEEVAA